MERDTIITQSDCNLCRYLATCIGFMAFQAFPDLQSMTFKKNGCPRDWSIEEENPLIKSSDSPPRPSLSV